MFGKRLLGLFLERERVFRVREIGFFNLREFPVWSYNIYVASGSFQTELNGPFTCYLDRGKGGGMMEGIWKVLD